MPLHAMPPLEMRTRGILGRFYACHSAAEGAPLTFRLRAASGAPTHHCTSAGVATAQTAAGTSVLHKPSEA